MAAGLSGLAFALFVGVMAFAVTTNASSSQPDDSMTRYFTTAGKVVELSTVAVPTPGNLVDAVSGVMGTGRGADSESFFELSPIEPDHVDHLLTRALARESRAERTVADALVPVEAAEPAETADASEAPVVIEPQGTPPPAAEVSAAAVGTAPLVEPTLAVGNVVQATVSFYYCQRGEQPIHPGDGGGFCGAMRDGTVVYPGAAACAYKYLGQRFRIAGDPLQREYVCADTGSAVHGLHRDIWFMSSDDGWDWQRSVGQVAEIEILQ